VKPAVPVANPAQRAVRPEQPVVRPEQPVARPEQRAARPEQRAARLAAPAAPAQAPAAEPAPAHPTPAPTERRPARRCYPDNAGSAATDELRMGLVMTKVTILNFVDLQNANAGLISRDSIRSVTLEALADTGAIGMAIPEDVAERLGAPVVSHERVRVADGRLLVVPRVGGLWIEVLERGVQGEAYVLPKGATPLLGAVQMELMDLVVVPASGEVIPNPAHPDGPILPLLRAS
jgi:predicted aspartyl protease